ncbi:MAG TPA: hypothetical protein VN767_20080 [Streptosporangiaceae bacterium]|nr:hypothetical protein [Streptosporangiaceae bacterium]
MSSRRPPLFTSTYPCPLRFSAERVGEEVEQAVGSLLGGAVCDGEEHADLERAHEHDPDDHDIAALIRQSQAQHVQAHA